MNDEPLTVLEHLDYDHGIDANTIEPGTELARHFAEHEPEDAPHVHPDYDPMTTVIGSSNEG